MQNELNRRRFLSHSTLFGTGVSFFPIILSGCGGAAATAQSSASAGQAPIPVPVAPPPPPPPPPPSARTEWKQLRVGAGGYVTGVDVASDGTKVVRTDSAGAYIWDDAAVQWKQLVTMTSMPAGTVGHEITSENGVYEVAIAPSNSSIIYIVFNGYVFRSNDKGVTFKKTSLIRIEANPNSQFRTLGRKMAVDPINPDIVYVGSEVSGLYTTADGGVSWVRRTDVPAPTTLAGIAIAFDRRSAVSAGKTSKLYIMSAGNGAFASSNAGGSFAALPGGPVSHRHMICDANSVLWLTALDQPSNNIWSYNGSWTNAPTAVGDQLWHDIATDPSNASHLVAISESGVLIQSFDKGQTWPLITGLNYPAGAGGRVATDLPWLAWTNEDYMSAGAICFDPSQANKLYFAQGIGVWWTNPPPTLSLYSWQSQSQGIEQLITTALIVPRGGSPLYFSWDRPVFKLDDLSKYPSVHGPNRKYSIVCGWSGAYAVDDSRFIVGLFNFWGREESGYSTDGGANWTKFATIPAEVSGGKIGGSIAVSGKDNIIWSPSNNSNPYRTKDRGLTWNRLSMPGVPTDGETGWGWAYYLCRHIVTADRVTIGTFYMYNYKDGCAGLYKSTDGGDNWVRAYTGTISQSSSFNATLASVPDKAGHLFFTSGPQSGPKPGSQPFMRSTDAGSTWVAVPNVLQVYCFGFGKAAPNSNYPAIFIAGYVGNAWGIWRSDDNAATWVKIGDYPLGSVDMIRSITGDMDRYGRIYVGFAGSGGTYAEIVTS